MQRILTTADVIAAIPGLIGFVPAESIVVVGITEHERGLQIGMTARHDIAGADQGFADYLAEVVYTHGLPRAAVIAITADDTAGDTSVRIMSDALMGYGIETDHRAVVARCDQPAPYRDLITGDTGISGDYRDSFASARRVMSGQYRAIRYAERLAECDAVASVGSKGDSYDNAMAEALNSLYKAELIRNRGQVQGRGVTRSPRDSSSGGQAVKAGVTSSFSLGSVVSASLSPRAAARTSSPR